jgi:hypothetical protein
VGIRVLKLYLWQIEEKLYADLLMQESSILNFFCICYFLAAITSMRNSSVSGLGSASSMDTGNFLFTKTYRIALEPL